MSQRHITVDARMLHSSGIGTYIRNLVPAVVSRFPDTMIHLLGNKSSLQGLPLANSSHVTLVNAGTQIYSVTEQLELFKKTPKSTSLFWSPHYNIPLAIRAQKRVVTIHDVNHLVFFDRLSLQQKIYARLMINLAVKLSDKIITVSDFSRAEIVKHTHVGGDKITVIHNGINTDCFKPLDNRTLSESRKKFELPDKFILFVGNVKPHKNLKRLISAYEAVYRRGLTDHYLVIAGQKEGFITADKGIFNILQHSSFLKERVKFTGYVDNADLPVLYNAASVFVFPSLYEGFGLPPLEAMACGCPVIVSHAASLPEVCGEGAYYVNPYDTENIAEGIYKVFMNDELRQSLIQKGLERAGIFTWENSIIEHIKVMKEIISV